MVEVDRLMIDELGITLTQMMENAGLQLARLAVDQNAQGKGIGKALLRFALGLAKRMSTDFGCVGVVVDAKPGAIDYYQKLGFEPIAALEGALLERPEPTAMFLHLSGIPAEHK